MKVQLTRYAVATDDGKDPLLDAMDIIQALGEYADNLSCIVSRGSYGSEISENALRFLRSFADEVDDVCEAAVNLLDDHNLRRRQVEQALAQKGGA